MHNAIGPLKGVDIINAIDYRIAALRNDLAKYSDSSIDFIRIPAITDEIVEAYKVRNSILRDSVYLAMPGIESQQATASSDPLLPALVDVAEKLVKRYVCNPGTDQEFIACVTPNVGSIGKGGAWDDWHLIKSIIDQIREREAGLDL